MNNIISYFELTTLWRKIEMRIKNLLEEKEKIMFFLLSVKSSKLIFYILRVTSEQKRDVNFFFVNGGKKMRLCYLKIFFENYKEKSKEC